VKQIGETFGQEIEVAGLAGLPFSWGSDGRINFGEAMTPSQIDAVNSVYEDHDPSDVLPN
jgi:hypothetical protein